MDLSEADGRYFSEHLSCVERFLSCLRFVVLPALALFIGCLFASESRAIELTLELNPVFVRQGPIRYGAYYPGDKVAFSARIDGLQTSSGAAVTISVSAKLLNDEGETIAKNPVDGALTPPGYCALFRIPQDAAPAKRHILVEVVDQHSGQTVAAKLPIEIFTPKTPYLVDVHFATNLPGAPPISGPVTVGDLIYLNFQVMGLRDDDDGRYAYKLQLLESGKVSAESLSLSVSNSQAGSSTPGQFRVAVDREFDGVGRLELSSDKGHNKNVVEIPLRVIKQR